MTGRHEVQLDVVIDDHLDGQPSWLHAEAIAELFLDDHLPLAADDACHDMTLPPKYNPETYVRLLADSRSAGSRLGTPRCDALSAHSRIVRRVVTHPEA